MNRETGGHGSIRPSDDSDETNKYASLSEIAAKKDRENEAKWAARMVCAGSLLTLAYEFGFLLLDRRFLSLAAPRILILHALNIGLFLAASLMAMRPGPFIRGHWKTIAFVFSSAMIAGSACIAIQTGEDEPLALAIILFLAGTGPFLRWGEKIQALLTAVAMASFATAGWFLPGPVDWYRWLAVSIGAAIGLFSTALQRRQRWAQRRTEDALFRSREMLVEQERTRIAGQLAAGIAHDLNNTLNVMALRFALIARDDEVRSAHVADIRAIDRALEDASRTVGRVRELGMRRVAGITDVVQLPEIVDQSIELATSSIERKSLLDGASVRIVSEVATDLPAVRGSSSELRQLFLNLLLNAGDAMPDGGTIRITSETERESVTVRVCDQGVGIPPNNLERIFEPFFTTKGSDGTGLGLALARKVMETLGGTISAGNDPAGHGAVFTLRFPIARPSSANAATEDFRASVCHYRFLIIDDHVDSLNALKDVLLTCGHSVETALSGSQALEKLRAGSDYDVIMCDLDMPGINGWELARLSNQIASEHQFFIVTGWGAQVRSAIPPGIKVCAVLPKPISRGDIDRIVAEVELKRSQHRIPKSA
jgi:signal transduction histidine kinase/CheY-like chemotaxis protein